jgi:muramoyltetrapeptide carboxypeptidase
VKPARIRPGDTVAVVAPAGVVDETKLADGIAALESLGVRVRCSDAVTARAGYLAGDDVRRREDLQRTLEAPDVRAVFCARGGYGCQRIVPGLALDGIAGGAKIVVGYSDVTALLTALVGRDLVAFHGPMVADDLARGLSDESRSRLHDVLFDPAHRWESPVPTPVRPGRARGRLLGGCLSVLVTTLGTPWQIDTRGAILFLEDVNERAYRLDRLLLHLRQAGQFDGVAGVVFGTLEGCSPYDGVDALTVVREHFDGAPYPVGVGLPAGHSAAPARVENHILPLGVTVELDTERGRLVSLEAAVA